MSTTITATKTFTEAALKAELGRRRNNKTRPKGEKVKPKSWVFPALKKADINRILEGEVVEVNFKSGRTEHVGLR